MTHLRSDRGSVTAWLVMVPAMMLLLCGLATDLWVATSVRARLAAAADDAAAAGATAIGVDDLRGGTPAIDASLAVSRASQVISGHADADSIDGHSVAVAGQVVTVTIQGHADLLLLRMVGPAVVPIEVVGSARPRADASP